MHFLHHVCLANAAIRLDIFYLEVIKALRVLNKIGIERITRGRSRPIDSHLLGSGFFNHALSGEDPILYFIIHDRVNFLRNNPVGHEPVIVNHQTGRLGKTAVLLYLERDTRIAYAVGYRGVRVHTDFGEKRVAHGRYRNARYGNPARHHHAFRDICYKAVRAIVLIRHGRRCARTIYLHLDK